jgi:dTDP-4-dehydrorhamnose reductase
VENDEIRVVNDKIGSPTFAADFVANARLVAQSGYYGTYLLTGVGPSTRYDIACEIVRILGLKTRVVPVSSAVFPLPAPRPRNDSARNLHLELLGLNRMRPWQEALAEYLKGWPLGPTAAAKP